MKLDLYTTGAELAPDDSISVHHVRVQLGPNKWVDIREDPGGVVHMYASATIVVTCVASNRVDIDVHQH